MSIPCNNSICALSWICASLYYQTEVTRFTTQLLINCNFQNHLPQGCSVAHCSEKQATFYTSKYQAILMVLKKCVNIPIIKHAMGV